MKSLKIAGLVAGVFVSAVAQAQVPLVKVDGSSTVYPITEAVAEEFQKSKKNAVRVTVGISGTGGGFKKFCRGETDISDASRPITAKEMADCKAAGIKYMELPVAFDALTVVVNPKNDWLKEGTIAELKTMWEPGAQTKIMKWNQVNPAYPDRSLKLFGPGADSGTFEYFTEAINGKAKASRGDFTASEDDNVLVQGVSRDVAGLGYFGYAYYVENKDKLRALPIVNSKGKAVLPSVEGVMSGEYEPLSRPIFIYVSAKAAERPEVKEFVEYYMKHAAPLVKEVKYVPLGEADYKHALDNFGKKKTGTAFGGHNEIGVKVSDLLKREPKE
jgi:phosphate transport system substrate-binding protein